MINQAHQSLPLPKTNSVKIMKIYCLQSLHQCLSKKSKLVKYTSLCLFSVHLKVHHPAVQSWALVSWNALGMNQDACCPRKSLAFPLGISEQGVASFGQWGLNDFAGLPCGHGLYLKYHRFSGGRKASITWKSCISDTWREWHLTLSLQSHCCQCKYTISYQWCLGQR